VQVLHGLVLNQAHQLVDFLQRRVEETSSVGAALIYLLRKRDFVFLHHPAKSRQVLTLAGHLGPVRDVDDEERADVGLRELLDRLLGVSFLLRFRPPRHRSALRVVVLDVDDLGREDYDALAVRLVGELLEAGLRRLSKHAAVAGDGVVVS